MNNICNIFFNTFCVSVIRFLTKKFYLTVLHRYKDETRISFIVANLTEYVSIIIKKSALEFKHIVRKRNYFTFIEIKRKD